VGIGNLSLDFVTVREDSFRQAQRTRSLSLSKRTQTVHCSNFNCLSTYIINELPNTGQFRLT
jgi:hypothetical protein